MRIRVFYIGFFGSLLLFVAVNIYDYYRMNEPVLIDGSVKFGLPFKFYMSGGFTGSAILWNGLIADVVIAVCASIIIGWASEQLFRTRSRLS